MTHQKRLAASRHWPVKRKEITFVTNSSPGPHKKAQSVPLNMVLRDMLKLTKTARETKKILNNGDVIIDNVVKKDHRLPVGFLDVITLKKINKAYIMMYDDSGKLVLKEHSQNYKKPYKIISKKMLKGNKLQLNLFNGKNLLVGKGDYQVGDSLLVENNKITKHFKLEKGQKVFLIGGKHIGSQGVIEEIKQKGSNNKKTVVIKAGQNRFETSKDYAYVIGDAI